MSLEITYETIEGVKYRIETDTDTGSVARIHFTGIFEPTLSEVKAQKIQELQNASDEATKTFKSSALGSAKTYLADEKSMTFLAGEYAFVKGPDYDNSDTDWFTVEDGFVTHTGAQLVQVFLDGRAWIKAQKTVKLKQLIIDVETATTVEDVQKISWQ